MKQLAAFTIPFVGLKQGEHLFEFEIDDKFFQHFEYEEFNAVRVQGTAKMLKKSNGLEFEFNIQGSVNVQCDLTNEPYDQHITGIHHLVVNFGEAYNDEDDSLLVLPHQAYEVNIQQYFYELIILSVPIKRVHPGVLDGTLHSDILDKLKELSPQLPDEDQAKESTDPRWDQLKKLLTDKQ
jgi:uncharacterized metal-binding protein YceD (DUF177 family)